MTFKEKLKELGLSEQEFNAFISAVDAEYVTKAEYEKASDSLKAVKAECERLSDNLNAMRIESERKLEFVKQSAENRLQRLKELYRLKLKEGLIDAAIRESGAKSSEIVRRLIDEEKVEIKEDKLIGLSGQITELRKKAPFLFEKTIMYLTGYCPEPSSDLLPMINPSEMTYSQALAYLDRE